MRLKRAAFTPQERPAACGFPSLPAFAEDCTVWFVRVAGSGIPLNPILLLPEQVV